MENCNRCRYKRGITRISPNDYIINVLVHIQNGLEADFGLKNAKVLRVLIRMALYTYWQKKFPLFHWEGEKTEGGQDEPRKSTGCYKSKEDGSNSQF